MPNIFISHAYEDKEVIARPLAEELKKEFTIWFDEYEMHVGDSLREKIDDGLRKCDYGVVVLSKAFFSKNWTQNELDGLFALETKNRKLILPIWHEVTKEDVLQYSPILAGRMATLSVKGIPSVVDDIQRSILASDRTRQIASIPPGMAALKNLSSDLALRDYQKKHLATGNGAMEVEKGFEGVVGFLNAAVNSINKEADTQRFNISNSGSFTIHGPRWSAVSITVNNLYSNTAVEAKLRATIFVKDRWTPQMEPKILEEIEYSPRVFKDEDLKWQKYGETVITTQEIADRILERFSHHIQVLTNSDPQ